ncbi:MAG: diaminopimelate decarboxylase [Chloroflexi bacterium]|nr:diaminopimelate decarboxylase [Chloroflexota bacterium]
MQARLAIFPKNTHMNFEGHLVIGGCDVMRLVADHGTPLYVFDEDALRAKCREYREEFARLYPRSVVLYASKAYVSPPLARIIAAEGLGLDVVSGGELAIVKAAGLPLDNVYFHGNNKSADELKMAVDLGIGRIVVDNFHEFKLLEGIASAAGRTQDILLRISPGVDPHTHGHTTTGIIDSKFGFPIVTGDAERAVEQAQGTSSLNLVGLHTHLGSPIFELDPYGEAIDIVLAFATAMTAKHGLRLREFSPGGGFAIQYVADSPPPAVADYARAIVAALKSKLEAQGLPRADWPRLVIEPGRSIVGQAGVALYTVGATKAIPGIRQYVSVDGGMADNIRPAIYGSKYEALVANRAGDELDEIVTIAGKFCESGDILIRDIRMPKLTAGDVIAIPASGAYCLSMASNYNASLKPPIALVKGGSARLIRRRETYQDLMRCDVD